MKPDSMPVPFPVYQCMCACVSEEFHPVKEMIYVLRGDMCGAVVASDVVRSILHLYSQAGHLILNRYRVKCRALKPVRVAHYA